MDIDEDPSKKKVVKGDDLAEYNLDDYDEDESRVAGKFGQAILAFRDHEPASQISDLSAISKASRTIVTTRRIHTSH